MWGSVLKSVGLAPADEYVPPRLVIGNAVIVQELSTGHFKIQVDAQLLSLTVQNEHSRIIWKSVHSQPFLFSSMGQDQVSPGDNGVFKVTEHDESMTRLQTITKVERVNDTTIKIHGGLGTKLVPPTKMDYVMTFEETSPHQIQFSVEITKREAQMKKYDHLILAYETRPEEQFYGFGEQFSYSTLKGQKIPILVRETGLGKGNPNSSSIKDSALSIFNVGTDYFATYASIPHYISSDIRSLCIENSEYMSFDLTEPERVVIRIESSKMKGRILDGKTMLDLMTEYTSFAGRMLPLPDWVSDGVIIGVHGGKQRVQETLTNLKNHDIPVAAVLVEDWTGEYLQNTEKEDKLTRQWWNWENDEDTYPSWPSFVDEVRKETRVMTYINPFLSDVSLKSRFQKNLFVEAREMGYLVKGIHDEKYLSIQIGLGVEVGLLDLTNPETRAWFKEILKKQVWNSDISGMMVDFGEYLPCDTNVALHSGESASTYHNMYPEDWAQLHREVMIELGKEQDAVCFFRSGYIHSPGHMNLFWSGDQNVSWDQNYGLRSVVNGMLSAGFSGFTVTHCDIGGSNVPVSSIPGVRVSRTKELLFRWMELASFTAAFRTTDGLMLSVNAQYYDDEASFYQLGHTANIFVKLTGYRKKALKEAYEKGWPLIRHLVLYYPYDKTVQEHSNHQFMLGSSLLVAPSLLSTAASVRVYFPKDAHKITWRHIWTGKYYPADGTHSIISAPIGQPAVFVKEPRDDDGLLNDLLDYATTYFQSKN